MKSGELDRGRFVLVWECAGLALGLVAGLLLTASACADGCFVAPPFVWDKHRDINEPTQKAIMVYDDGREDLILQVKYRGPVEQFGWLVPVPNRPTVEEGSMESFYALSRYTQKDWETWFVGWRGDETNGAMAITAGARSAEQVKVLEIKTVGAYEVAVLCASESGSLKEWLAANHFSFPADKAGVIDAYVKQHWYFIAVRVDLSKAGGFQLAAAKRKATVKRIGSSVAKKLAEGELPPLQISFTSDECVFPLKFPR